MPFDEQISWRMKQGRPALAIELKLVDEAGACVAEDGVSVGRLMVRGPTIARGYYAREGEVLDAEGFFDTGDIATIDPSGCMQITDRAKDVIKSGGEWISSIEIENIVAGHPAVAFAAVVGVAHPKWDERPLLLIQLKPGQHVEAKALQAFLAPSIAKWWMPDDVVFLDEIPLGATGKVDKKGLRTRFEGHYGAERTLASAS